MSDLKEVIARVREVVECANKRGYSVTAEFGNHNLTRLLDAAEAGMTAGRLHASDCAVNNRPALPAGPCTCGADTGNTPDAVVQAIAAEAAATARDAGWNDAMERVGQKLNGLGLSALGDEVRALRRTA